ncbi:hypothetical protein ACVWZV_008284 [Bradyrhizobium sp. GM5.1]
MPILIATSLLHAHPFKFAFSFGCVLVLALHFDDQRLLLGEPAFSFDDVALDLPQLIVYRRRVHPDPRAAVLRSTPQSRFRFVQGLYRARGAAMTTARRVWLLTQPASRTFRLMPFFPGL